MKFNLRLNSVIFALIIILSNLSAISFSQTKKVLLKKIYFDNQFTFYCGNPYEIKQIKGKQRTVIIEDKKYYSPKNSSFFNFFANSNNERSKVVEWEHVVPIQVLAQNLPCWKDGGRKACNKDNTFRAMESDMYNLVPAIGEINNDRSNYKFGDKLPKKQQYGKCEFEVDSKNKIAYPKKEIRGDIARIYFYMSNKYNFKISKQEKIMFEKWNQEDPISQWEKTKIKRIEEFNF